MTHGTPAHPTHAFGAAAVGAAPRVWPKPSLAGAGTLSFATGPLPLTGVLLPLAAAEAEADAFLLSSSCLALIAFASSSSRSLSYPSRLIRSSSSMALRCASSKLMLVVAFFAPSLDTLAPPPIPPLEVFELSRVAVAGRLVG